MHSPERSRNSQRRFFPSYDGMRVKWKLNSTTGKPSMLFNRDRALKKMDAAGLDALVACAPRNVYYASGFWTRISEWGSRKTALR